MHETLYRRPLPASAIAFSSPEGRQVFAEALAMGGLDGYFSIAEQFHTQSDPTFCGLGSLVVALNGLGIDPGRLWKGPWRWFAEDLLDCCVPLAKVRERGLNLDELACLARCNGAEVALQRADASSLADFRSALEASSRGENVVIAAYDRRALGQTGSGHFSPLAGYHAGRDLALILDVARFKYPPHWVTAESLWLAMQPLDPNTGRARGWMSLRRCVQASAAGFTITCDGESLEGLAQRLSAITSALDPAADLHALASAILPLAAHLEERTPTATAHQEALLAARASLRNSAGFPDVVAAVGAAHAEAVTILLLAISEQLTPSQRAALGTAGESRGDASLAEELSNLRAQLAALWIHVQP